MSRTWIERLRASVLSALLVGTVLTVVVGAPTPASAQTTTDTDTETPEPVARQYAGADRYETSANLAYSYAAKSASSNSVILAGGGLIDAAAAAGLARALNAPVLLTPTDTLSPQARQFIIDEGITTIYIVGGTAAVSAAVADELAALPNPPTIERLAGPDRYATSAALSRAITQPAGTQPAGTQPAAAADYCGTGIPTAVLANVDKTFADVIALGPLAYSQRLPVLLTSVDSLSQAVTDYLAEAGIQRVVVVGGTAAVSPAVVAQLQAAGTQVQRVAGATRYATALSIREEMGACEGLTLSPSTYALINGEASADGIAAGPLLGLGLASDGVTAVLLVERDQLPPESRQHLDAVNAAQQNTAAHPPVVLTVIGGVAVVSPEVAQAAAETAAATQAVATTTTTTTTPDDDDDDNGGGGGGSGGGGSGGNSGGTSTTTTTTTTTTVPTAITLSGLPATAPIPFTFGGANQRQDFAFTVTPGRDNLTFTATSTGLLTALFEGGGGVRNLILNAPASDDDASSGYSGTLTITVTDDTGVVPSGSHDIAFTITPTPITLSGFPADAEDTFSYGVAAREIDFQVSPAAVASTLTATVTPASTLFQNVSVTEVSSGNWRLSLQPPATAPASGPYSETLTITVSDTGSGARTAVTHDLTFTVPTPATDLVLTGLPSTAPMPFTFGGTDQTQTFDFTVTPASTSVTFTADTVGLATASVAAIGANAGDYRLTVEVPASDDDNSFGYSDTVTVTATDTTGNLTAATHNMALTITPTPITLSVVTADATAAFEFGDDARDIEFDVFPDAVLGFLDVTVSTATLFQDVEITEDLDRYTLSLRPPATDPGSGPYTETLTVTVSYDDRTFGGARADATQNFDFTINPTVVAPITLTGLPDTATTPFTFSGTNRVQTFPFSVTPTTATFATPTTTSSTVTAAVTARGTTAGDYTLTVTAPTTDSGLGPYTDTITVTASAPGTADVSHDVAVTLTPAPITLSGLLAAANTPFDFNGADRTFSFTAVPANANLTFTAVATGTATNGVTASVADRGTGVAGEYTLTVTAPATDSGEGPYSDTITVTATDTDSAVTGRAPATHAMTITLTPAPIALTGVPTGADTMLVYASGATTSTITVTPPHITLAASATGAVTAGIAVDDADAGTWTLTVTAPSTGTATTGTVTITPDDPTGLRTETPETINYTITPRLATPTFDDVTGDNIINMADQAGGVTLTGAIGNDTTGVTLCFGGTDDACTGGASAANTVTVTGTTWTYTLVAADYTAMGQGSETLRATATGTDGNTSVVATRPITVDTISPTFTSGATGAVAVNAAITVIVYDAEATDNGGASETADAGITYALSGTDSGLFAIDSDNGEITYLAVQAATATHTVIVTATDTAGNATTLDVTISVLDAPEVTISDSVTAEYTNGAVTFTFTWSEDVTGFEAADLSYALGHARTGTTVLTTVDASTYTTVFTPDTTGTNATNDATVDITVAANAVTGAITSATNIATTASQKFDTVAPVFAAGATATATFTAYAAITTEVYDAEATDNGAADVGITYSLSGTDAALFAIDSAAGVVTYRSSPTAAATHNIIVTATDKGANTATIAVTVTVPTPSVIISLTNASASSAAFAFDEAARTVTFDVTPADATFQAVSTNAANSANNAFTITKVLNSGTARSFTLTPPDTDDGAGPYTDTITITATATDHNDATETIDVTLTPTPSVITNLPSNIPLTINGGTQSFNFNITPAGGTYEISVSGGSIVSPTVALASNGNAGEFTLTLTPPITDPGANYAGSITISIRDTVNNRALISQSVSYAIATPPITLTSLPTGVQPVFDFGDDARTFDFTVYPTDATVTADSANNVFTTEVTGTGANRVLSVTPPATDVGVANGGRYSDTITVTATDLVNGRETVTHTVTFTITEPVTFAGLPTGPDTAFVFGVAQDFTFTVSPATASVTVDTPRNVFGATLTDNGGGSWTLSVTPPADDTGVYSGRIVVRGRATGYNLGTASITFSITGPAPEVAVTAEEGGHEFVVAVSSPNQFDLAEKIVRREITLNGAALPSTARIFYQLDTRSYFANSETTFNRFKNLAIVCLNGLQNQHYISSPVSSLLPLPRANAFNTFVDSCKTAPDSGTAITLSARDEIVIEAGAIETTVGGQNVETTHYVEIPTERPALVSATVTDPTRSTYLNQAGPNQAGTVYAPDAETSWIVDDPNRSNTKLLVNERGSTNEQPGPLFTTVAGDQFYIRFTESNQHLGYLTRTISEHNRALLYGTGTCRAHHIGRITADPPTQSITYRTGPNAEVGDYNTASFLATTQIAQFRHSAYTQHANGVVIRYQYFPCFSNDELQQAQYHYRFRIYSNADHTLEHIKTALAEHTTHPFWKIAGTSRISGYGTEDTPIDGGAGANFEIMSKAEFDALVDPIQLTLSAKADGIAAGDAGDTWTISFTDLDAGGTAADTDTDAEVTVAVDTANTQIAVSFDDDATITDLMTAASAVSDFDDNFEFTLPFERNLRSTLLTNPDALRFLAESSPTTSPAALASEYEATITLQYDSVLQAFNLAELFGTSGDGGIFDFPFKVSVQPSTSYRQAGLNAENVAPNTIASGTETLIPAYYYRYTQQEAKTPEAQILPAETICLYDHSVLPANQRTTSAAAADCRTQSRFITPTDTVTITLITSDTAALPVVDDIITLPAALATNYRDPTDPTNGTSTASTATLVAYQQPIELTGLPNADEALLDYAAAPSTFTLTANPADATVRATSANDVVTASVDVLNAAAGTYTLTITPPGTPPNTGTTTYTDTVTITATATDRGSFSQTITFTVTPTNPAPTFTDIDTADTSTFAFGDATRMIDFTVSPTTAQVTISPTASQLFSTWEIADNGGTVGGGNSYTLSIGPAATNPGIGTFTETLTITAIDDGSPATTVQLPFEARSPIALSGLPTAPDTTLIYGQYGSTPSTFTITTDLPDATLNVASASSVVTPTITVLDAAAGTHTLTITPPATGTTHTTDTVTITATDPAGTRITTEYEVTFTVNALVVITGLPTAAQSQLSYGTTASFNITVDPAGATLSADSASSVVTTSFDVINVAAGTYRLTLTPPITGPAPVSPATESAATTDTVTITVTDPDGVRADTTRELALTVGGPVVITGLPFDGTATSKFDGPARTFEFTVEPATATVTAVNQLSFITSTVSVARASSGNAGEWTLTYTPPPLTNGTAIATTMIIGATAAGRQTFERVFRIQVRQGIILTGLPDTPEQTTLNYGADASEFTITSDLATATLTATSASGIVTPTITVLNAAAGTYTLAIDPPDAPPATGTNVITDTVTIIARDPSDNNSTRISETQEVTFTVMPAAAMPAAAIVLTGVSDQFNLSNGSSDTRIVTATPTNAILTVESSDSLVTVDIVRNTGGAAGEWTLTATASSFPFGTTYLSGTITVTATDPDGSLSEVMETFDFEVL